MHVLIRRISKKIDKIYKTTGFHMWSNDCKYSPNVLKKQL